LPPEIGNLTGLRYLVVDNNPLTGEIPVDLTTLINLSGFYFYETGWCAPADGPVADWLSGITKVYGTGMICGQAPGAMSGLVVCKTCFDG